MNALHTFRQLRPSDEPLDEITSARIWRAIMAETPAGTATTASPVDDDWVDPFAGGHLRRHSPRRRVGTVAAAAVVLAGLGGLAALQASRSQGTTASLGSASAGETTWAGPPTSALPETTVLGRAAPSTPVPTTAMPNQLPEGGLWIGGQLPTCTALATDTFECTLPAPYDASMPDATGYEIGMQMFFVDNSSLVAGGCRTTTSDARTWRCYSGRRAVDEGYLYGPMLGTWQPNEFAAG